MATAREYITASDDETIRLGHELARDMMSRAALPRLVLLIGDLGAGKTTLAKGIAAGLGAAAEDDVTSPSFTLVHEYERRGSPRVFHADLYRLEGRRDVATLGLEDLLDPEPGAGPSLMLVEWGEKAPYLFGGSRWEIRLSGAGSGGEQRTIRVEEFDG